MSSEPLDLDAIARRVPTHYDAPWRVEYLEASADNAERWLVGYATDNPLAGLVAAVPDYGEDLAEFIAHARTDVPVLLAEVARLALDHAQARGEATALAAERDEWVRDAVRGAADELAAMRAERDAERAKVEVLLLGDKALQARIWLGEECARLKAERDRLAATVERVRALADRMERESPKPGPGGFLADELRTTLSATETPTPDRPTTEASSSASGDAGGLGGVVAAERRRYIACQLPMADRRWCVRQIGHPGDCAWSIPLDTTTEAPDAR
jgi:hypothetical protein